MIPMESRCPSARSGPLRVGPTCPRYGLSAVAMLLLLVWLAVVPAGAAESGEDLGNRVKAAFIYKFANYVEWPAGLFPAADTPIRIAVIGADPVATELASMVVGRTVQGRPLVIRRIAANESIVGFHVVFFGAVDAPGLRRAVEAAQAQSTLVVTDFADALELGSMINFTVAERRLKFEIALDRAEKSGLKLSSRLLAVALRVRTGAP